MYECGGGVVISPHSTCCMKEQKDYRRKRDSVELRAIQRCGHIMAMPTNPICTTQCNQGRKLLQMMQCKSMQLCGLCIVEATLHAPQKQKKALQSVNVLANSTMITSYYEGKGLYLQKETESQRTKDRDLPSKAHGHK